MIQEVTDSNIEAARRFLECHAETSLFLLSNLTALGPRLGESFNSGNFRCIVESGAVAAVFCLTRRGNLLVQTGGRADQAGEIFHACDRDVVPIQGVVGEWRAAEALWRILCAQPAFRPNHTSKEVLLRLDLAGQEARGPIDDRVRLLEPSDFAEWERLNTAYRIEAGLPMQGTAEQRRATFVSQSAAGHWWRAVDARRLVAIAGLNAVYRQLGQTGGVYTPPDRRRKGLARSVMQGLIADARHRHGLEQLVLFTDEDNAPAQGLYASLGFTARGHFGLLFGVWGPERGSEWQNCQSRGRETSCGPIA